MASTVSACSWGPLQDSRAVNFFHIVGLPAPSAHCTWADMEQIPGWAEGNDIVIAGGG